jgi:hypothetical protein
MTWRFSSKALALAIFTGGEQCRRMSTAAQIILDQIEALPPSEREEVLDAALKLREQAWQEQQARLLDEPALLAEAALADWNRPEEDAAWQHLQQVR